MLNKILLMFGIGLFCLVIIRVSATTVYLTTTDYGNWTAPVDWNSANNVIEVIGGGGSTAATKSLNSNGGGGGGAYSKIVNTVLIAGNNYSYFIGHGGVYNSSWNGSDTYFCNANVNCNNISDVATIISAQGGGGVYDSLTGGAGGNSSKGIGTIKYSGGNGGNADAGRYCGGGGGGSGGMNGIGLNGTNASRYCGGMGGNGDGGFGGLGGNSTCGGLTANIGNNGTEWGLSYGSGGGGSGGNVNAVSSVSSGANGGFYGAGGGAGHYSTTTSSGNGTQGIIVITYTPEAGGNCTYSGSGNWTITDNCDFTEAIDVEGNDVIVNNVVITGFRYITNAYRKVIFGSSARVMA